MLHIAQASLNNWVRLATSDLQLENFVMLKWTEDQTVIPRESRFTIIGHHGDNHCYHDQLFFLTVPHNFVCSHFEFYIPGQSDEVLPLRESQLYLDDFIGILTLLTSWPKTFLSRFAEPWWIGKTHFLQRSRRWERHFHSACRLLISTHLRWCFFTHPLPPPIN